MSTPSQRAVAYMWPHRRDCMESCGAAYMRISVTKSPGSHTNDRDSGGPVSDHLITAVWLSQ